MKNSLKLQFIVLFFHLLITSLIFVTKRDNINVANVLPSNQASALQQVNIFLLISVIMIGIELLFAIIGLPFYYPILPFQMIFQILGLISYSWFILLKMHYRTLSFMWGVFCLIPFVLDIIGRISGLVSFRKYNALDYR